MSKIYKKKVNRCFDCPEHECREDHGHGGFEYEWCNKSHREILNKDYCSPTTPIWCTLDDE